MNSIVYTTPMSLQSRQNMLNDAVEAFKNAHYNGKGFAISTHYAAARGYGKNGELFKVLLWPRSPKQSLINKTLGRIVSIVRKLK